jgi:NADPH2:quinone reductase
MNSAHAIRIHEHGDPGVLRWEEIEVPDPGPGEVLVRHTAIGLNFIDTYHRSGLYPVPSLPAVPGVEAVGRVEKVGPGVDGLAPGDRVAYAVVIGAYATLRIIPSGRLVRPPESIDDEIVAGYLLKGMTAGMLLRTAGVAAGGSVLVRAAAGGVGLILSQWASAAGLRVIGTAGTEAKADLAHRHGCDEVIVSTKESLPGRIADLTGGRGVAAVFDGVGRSTFEESLEALSLDGFMVSYGNASGPVAPFELLRLSKKNLRLARPSLVPHVADGARLRAAAAEAFGMLTGGRVVVTIGRRLRLRDAAEAHRLLEARATSGATVLLPATD